ncbi:MAG: rhodanese-like domain-containing protein [Pseudomonadota bacterium]|nr:rhodanese-like domain-containing protein [Pseudomonadota bacterium]
MKFLLDHWYLILAALVSGTMLLWPLLTAGGAGKVSANDAIQMINRERAVLIDVSEPAEYAAGHVAGSKSVPLKQIESSSALPKNKALPLLVVCATGARAGRAVAVFKKLGYENTRVLAGGLQAWRAANLPIEKSVA